MKKKEKEMWEDGRGWGRDRGSGVVHLYDPSKRKGGPKAPQSHYLHLADQFIDVDEASPDGPIEVVVHLHANQGILFDPFASYCHRDELFRDRGKGRTRGEDFHFDIVVLGRGDVELDIHDDYSLKRA
jgi:hypothetical protein